jgi:hypothetical protein
MRNGMEEVVGSNPDQVHQFSFLFARIPPYD